MKKRILCYGDSNTWGFRGGLETRYDESIRWTCRLQDLLGEGYAVIEEGQNGRTTVWDDPIENRMSGLEYLWPCMESASPFDMMILMLGTNDTKRYFAVEAANIAKGIKRLVSMAMASPFWAGESKLLLVSPGLIEYSPVYEDMFGHQAAKKSRDFSVHYYNAARELNCDFLDAAKFVTPCEEDGVHFTPGGHAALAQAFCGKVKEMIG